MQSTLAVGEELSAAGAKVPVAVSVIDNGDPLRHGSFRLGKGNTFGLGTDRRQNSYHDCD
jgi:hypothetical protein